MDSSKEGMPEPTHGKLPKEFRKVEKVVKKRLKRARKQTVKLLKPPPMEKGVDKKLKEIRAQIETEKGS